MLCGHIGMVTAITLAGSDPGINAPYLVSEHDNRVGKDYMGQPCLFFVGRKNTVRASSGHQKSHRSNREMGWRWRVNGLVRERVLRRIFANGSLTQLSLHCSSVGAGMDSFVSGTFRTTPCKTLSLVCLGTMGPSLTLPTPQKGG